MALYHKLWDGDKRKMLGFNEEFGGKDAGKVCIKGCKAVDIITLHNEQVIRITGMKIIHFHVCNYRQMVCWYTRWIYYG